MESTITKTQTRPKSERSTKQPRLWNVVLLDDEDHTYEYVIEMMMRLFGHSVEKAFQIAKTVDADGRAICMTTHRELGELKVEQIHGIGPDMLLDTSAGSMSAILEPADFGGDEDDE